MIDGTISKIKTSLLNKIDTIYIFIFMGVNFRGFCGHLVIS